MNPSGKKLIKTGILTGALTVCFVAGGWLVWWGGAVLFGPPQVTLRETYQEKVGEPVFDHGLWDRLLKKYVNDAGGVDYVGLASESGALERYLATLARAPFDAMGRSQKLALLINAYNAFTVKLILEHNQGDTLRSIQDIPKADRWEAVRWHVGGHVWSLRQIEHEQIRPRFREPRVHFALVCAALGCPPLRAEAYVADRLEEQLDEQTRYVHTHARWLVFHASTSTLSLTRLYKWYGHDFEQVAGSVVKFVSRYVVPLQKVLEAGGPIKIQWKDYDWSLNRASSLASK